jgi:hypothetical protein
MLLLAQPRSLPSLPGANASARAAAGRLALRREPECCGTKLHSSFPQAVATGGRLPRLAASMLDSQQTYGKRVGRRKRGLI